MEHWFKPTKTGRSKSERHRRARQYVKKGSTTSRTSLKLRPPNHVFFKTYARWIHINGIGVKVCTRNAIANFFDVANTTVYRWDAHGLLPEPFYHIPARGAGMAPVYLASQVLVLRRVLEDLVKQGYVTIPWSRLPDHVAMLKDGYEQAANRAYRKFEASEEIEKPDRFGVVFD